MLAVLGLAAGFAGLPVEAVAQAGTTTGGETADPAQTAIFLVNNTSSFEGKLKKFNF